MFVDELVAEGIDVGLRVAIARLKVVVLVVVKGAAQTLRPAQQRWRSLDVHPSASVPQYDDVIRQLRLADRNIVLYYMIEINNRNQINKNHSCKKHR